MPGTCQNSEDHLYHPRFILAPILMRVSLMCKIKLHYQGPKLRNNGLCKHKYFVEQNNFIHLRQMDTIRVSSSFINLLGSSFCQHFVNLQQWKPKTFFLATTNMRGQVRLVLAAGGSNAWQGCHTFVLSHPSPPYILGYMEP